MTAEVIGLFDHLTKTPPKLPAVVPPPDLKKLEDDALYLIVEYCAYQAGWLLSKEDPEAFASLSKGLQRQKSLYKARELVTQIDPRLEKAIFAELGLGNDPPLPPGPSTYSA